MVAAAVIGTLPAACTGGAGQPGSGKASPLAKSGHTSAQPATLPASSAAPAAESVLDCGTFIDTQAPPASMQVVLGVVALPTSPGSPALQTSLSGTGPLRLFAKTGLLIKPDNAFELIVPTQFSSRLSIGWGSPGTPSHRLLVGNCANTGVGWLAFAGGYWVDHPACVAIVVKAGGKEQQVRIGVGSACPSQQPPQGPTQS